MALTSSRYPYAFKLVLLNNWGKFLSVVDVVSLSVHPVLKFNQRELGQVHPMEIASIWILIAVISINSYLVE
jgi:hypothetical protein